MPTNHTCDVKILLIRRRLEPDKNTIHTSNLDTKLQILSVSFSLKKQPNQAYWMHSITTKMIKNLKCNN